MTNHWSPFALFATRSESSRHERDARSVALLYIEQFYFPDGWGGAQIPRDVTRRLVDTGHRVKVLCGSDPYVEARDESTPDPRKFGIAIVKVPRLFPGGVHRFKLLRQIWFCAYSIPQLFLRTHSLFIAQTNPPLLLPLLALASAIRRVPLVIVVQDLYPDILFAGGFAASERLIGRILTRVFSWTYRRAARVVCLGPYMAARLQHKGVPANRIAEIPNWATGDDHTVDGEQNRLRELWGVEGKFVLLYSGNLGVAHDVETPILAFAEARRRIPNLVLIFVGEGVRLEEARAVTHRAGVDAVVQFHPFLPSDLFPHGLGLADLALVTLQPNFAGLSVPNKMMSYLSRGLPMLFIGPPSDVQRYLEESGGGFCFENGDVKRIAEKIADLHSQPGQLTHIGVAGRSYYERVFARSIALSRYEKVIEDVTAANLSRH